MAAAPSPPLVPLSIGKYAVVRFLGAEDGVHAGPDATGVERYIVRAEAAGDAAPRLILERVLRSHVPAPDFDAFTRRARRIAMLRHPNVPRVRDVFTTAEDAVVVTEFIEGKRWGSLDARAASHHKVPLSLEVRLKLLLDAISALAGLHALREPGWSSTSTGAKVPSMIHGDVTPSSVLVGTDGVARLLRIHRTPLRPPSGPLDERSARCAPEILLGDGTADGRADVYSIGVMLWETLSGKRLFTQPTVAEMLSRQLAGDLPTATTSVAWAAPLVEIASAALAVDPKRRYATAIDLGMAIRNVAGHRVAGASEVARQVAAILGKSGAKAVASPVVGAAPVLRAPEPEPLASIELEEVDEVDFEEVATQPPPELDAIDERWSKVSMPPPAPLPSPPAAPAAPPVQVAPVQVAPPAYVAPPVQVATPVHVPPPIQPPPMLAPTATYVSAPLRMTPAPPPHVAPPSVAPLRPSDVTELQARAPRRKRQILIVMFLAALLLFVSVCTMTLLLHGPKPNAAAPAKPAESSAPKSLAVATPAPPPPAPTPAPPAVEAAPTVVASPAAVASSAPAPTPTAAPVRRAVAAPVSPAPPKATPQAPPKAAPPAPPTPKAAAVAPKSSPPPTTKPRPKRSTYVPLGI